MSELELKGKQELSPEPAAVLAFRSLMSWQKPEQLSMRSAAPERQKKEWARVLRV